jgi:hypothetical protein
LYFILFTSELQQAMKAIKAMKATCAAVNNIAVNGNRQTD